MFSSIFSTTAPEDANPQNFYDVSSKFSTEELMGVLEPKDTEWLCARGGFVTETQTFYTITEDGLSIMCQVIHSSIGVWFPTIQFTCKVHDTKTRESIWKSINVSNFVSPPPGLDKRSSKADEFSITYATNPGTVHPEYYTIHANLGDDLQINLTVKRPTAIPGFKIGRGPAGGYSYFGNNISKPDGYVIHRFWPRFDAEGTVVRHGNAVPLKGEGMFVHAIQGMRPNLVASAWNFAHFQSSELGGVTAIQMEFTTQDAYGKRGAGSGGVAVNIGGLVVAGRLVSVMAQTRWPGEPEDAEANVVACVEHREVVHDSDTGYKIPTEIEFVWKGPNVLDVPGEIEARMKVDLGGIASPKGLIAKVDVLGEIPKVLKLAVNYVAGAKPYIYQWINPTKLWVKAPDALAPGLSEGILVNGWLYNEASFISR